MFIKLKQSPDESASSIGLNKYGKSMLPGAFQILQPAKDKSGRWITGIDEDATKLRKELSGDEYIEVRDSLKEERESLERATGLDLSATSKYWDDYFIRISGDRMFDLDFPADRIDYKVLLANQYAAPNLESISSPEYNHVKFYLTDDASEESNKATIKKEKNRAIAELTKIEENKNRLFIIAKFIFANSISDEITTDSLYNMLSDYIMDDKKGKDIRKFNSVVDKTTEELQIKITVDEANRFHVIRQRDNVWQHGNITLGKSLEDVVKYLSKVENSNELGSIIEEVREKRLRG